MCASWNATARPHDGKAALQSCLPCRSLPPTSRALVFHRSRFHRRILFLLLAATARQTVSIHAIDGVCARGHGWEADGDARGVRGATLCGRPGTRRASVLVGAATVARPFPLRRPRAAKEKDTDRSDGAKVTVGDDRAELRAASKLRAAMARFLANII
jgi:hypothetical protein